MGKLRDLTGRRYGRLDVIRRDGSDRFGRAAWLCRCDCGSETVKPGYYLTSGDTRSCGCLQVELSSRLGRGVTHGGTDSKEFHAWQAMLARCYRKTNASYKHYGGRGIVVCERWRHSFANFLRDVGKKPGTGFSLDRINNNGNYEPGNCRWATAVEQQNNKRWNGPKDPRKCTA